MRILYLVNTLDTANGWGRFSRELITRFGQSGVDVAVLSENSSGFPGERTILARSWRALLTSIKIRKILAQEKYDIVHSFEVNPYGISAALALLGRKEKHVITATGAYSVRPLYQISTSFLTKFAYKHADSILCISAYIRDEINKVIFLPQSTVATLGVDLTKFSGERVKPKERFILGVGNLSFRKGYHVSVAAFAEVAQRVPDVKYYIAGALDTGTYTRCKEIITRAGIEDRVVFLGSQNDSQLKELYLSAELFVLTSVNEDMHFEGFGLVFLEAASAGLPVIGTTGNGIGDAMEEGVNGLLVPQNDVTATAEAITSLLTDTTLRESFGRASLEVASRNTWEVVVKKYIAVYDSLLHGKK